MQKLTHHYDWQRLLSSPDNFPKFMFDAGILTNAVALGKALALSANEKEGMQRSTKSAAQEFIKESPFVAVKALIDTFFICQKGLPDKISQLEELFGTRHWILELYKKEVGLEPVAPPATSATLIVRVPALDDGGGDVAMAYRLAAALKKEFNNNTVVLLVAPGALEWARRYASSLSFDKIPSMMA
jgi:hypothetical protein